MQKQKNTTLYSGSLLASIFFISAASLTQAAVITFEGIATPDANVVEGSNPTTNTNLYATTVFSGTNWVAEDGFLKMNTAPSRGLWFGAFPGFSDPGTFFPSDTSSGNKLRLTSLLTSGSQSWTFDMTDASGNYGHFMFNFTETTDSVPDQPGVWVTTADGSLKVTNDDFNINVLHTYEIHIHDNIVAYSIDGDEVYRGAALKAGIAGSYFIGDTSGSTVNGTGSMWVDYMELDNAAGALSPIPEPSVFSLFVSFFGFLTAGRRRRIRG